ncbi:hypothetical protein EA515_19075 [Salmonella enterica subsp. enterica serovar Give]|nr:hypothetical protein [Salmonella enterica subsp. enterica serovar Give]
MHLLFSADPKKAKAGSGLINRMEGQTRYVRKEFKAKGRWERKVRFERGADVSMITIKAVAMQ